MSVTDKAPVRGGVYPLQSIRRGDFLVVSIPTLTSAEFAIVVEVTSADLPNDPRGLLAVQLQDHDPLPGAWAQCWRINWVRGDRLDIGACHGVVSGDTMAAVVRGVTNAIQPL